jgi:hypothetical protein
LLLEALESVVDNQYFDIEMKIVDIISILIGITLQANYHSVTSDVEVMALKDKNAFILGQLFCNHRCSKNIQELKNDCANILLKTIFDVQDAQDDKINGAVKTR